LGALGPALDAISGAAVIACRRGRVRYANAAGRAMLARDAAGVRDQLRDALAGRPDSPWELTRLQVRGVPSHVLLVLRRPVGEPEGRLEAMARRYNLSPRQGEVLSRLIRGASNKVIAAELGCSVRTVELHVTQLLNRTDTHSRSELVAAFWLK
jgi:DNA-binding NarL/FixJ family response regulator